METDIPSLAAAARRGELTAYEKLVKLFMRRAYFFCLGICGNREDALDISQNAFVRAWRGIGRLADPESFPSWLYSILRNETANFLKKRGRMEHRELTGQKLLETVVTGESPDETATRREVWEAIGRLPLEMREIIVMKHLQGMSYNEISGLLDIPRGSVASRLYRARAELKRKLDGRV
ncbi:MAG: RNA polymerase sigma factor [Candidatus Glassbacteria bacterium]|nr:RNA polymerase sigma factor [Candidatus Glassbacteria bacterium]